MLELAAQLLPRVAAGERVGVVTVIGVVRGAPRGPGASLAVLASGEVVGSISGGCVESDAVALAAGALATGSPREVRLGFSADGAEVSVQDVDDVAGLACGGAVDVIAYAIGAEAIDALRAAAAGEDAAAAIDRATGLARSLGPDAAAGADEVVVRRRPRPRLIIAGAGAHAAALCRVGAAAGFAVTIVDPWELLVTAGRFPEASERVVADPAVFLAAPGRVDERTAVCVLTHDERLDVRAIEVALGMPVGFVGAMGARSTVARRTAELMSSGVTAEELARLHSPLGLDLGGASVEDAAVAAIAEIVAVRHGGSGRSLREMTGPIHHRVVADDPQYEIPLSRPGRAAAATS